MQKCFSDEFFCFDVEHGIGLLRRGLNGIFMLRGILFLTTDTSNGESYSFYGIDKMR
jgi:hypothetical protein